MINNQITSTAPPKAPFAWYLGASTLWLAGMTLSSFAVSWLLVERLHATPEQTGWAYSASRIVPLFALLAGGLLTDRTNNRSYLVVMHALIALPPLLLAITQANQWLSYPILVGYMVILSALQALSDPARQAALSRIAPTDIQRSVTLVALVSSGTSFAVISFGGMMDALGDTPILLGLTALFALGLWPILQLPSLPALRQQPPDSATPGWPDLWNGARSVWRGKVLRQTLGFNFCAALFNAGAYTVAIPFIASTVYAGGSATFAGALAAITLGAGLSNALLLALMPFKRPGQLLLCFQLTRAAILLGLWWNIGEWAFYLLMGLWGLNMGTTSTLTRGIVQECAPQLERGRILALMLLSFMLASAIGAPVLGALVGAADPLTALLPGAVMSALIFVAGWRRDLWYYRSATTSP